MKKWFFCPHLTYAPWRRLRNLKWCPHCRALINTPWISGGHRIETFGKGCNPNPEFGPELANVEYAI